MNRFKVLLFYVIIAAFLSMVGEYNFSFLNLIVGTFILMVSIFFSENIDDFFSKIKRIYFPVLFIAAICSFNGILYFLTDSKDFYVLFFIQVLWGILGTFVYFIKKLILKNDNNFFEKISQWYISFFILILMDRLISGIKFLNFNVDIFHFIIAVFVWKVINIFMEVKGILNLRSNVNAFLKK